MKNLLSVFFSGSLLVCNAQTFTSGGGAIINNGGLETVFSMDVSGLPSPIDSVYGLEEIGIDISHPAVHELQILLVSPSGTTVDLTGAHSCMGANFDDTFFNNNGLSSITLGSAPYTGTFRPVGNLGRFNTGKNGNGTWKIHIKDFVAGPNSGMLGAWSLRFGNAPAKPVIFTSSNLPIVRINASGQPISDNDLIVQLAITDNGNARNNLNDPPNNFNGKAAVHLRGSSARMFEKKSMKMELKDASGSTDLPASLLGMPAETDWLLVAGYPDKTLLRNALSQQIWTMMGRYGPRYRFVELVLNDEYFGVYLLMEQIKRGKDRVDIDKITSMDNQFPYITGGYIVQINRSDDPGWYSLYPGISNTGAKFYYQYNYPRHDAITDHQKNYIKAVLDSFELVMNSPDYGNPVSGYRKFINEYSFADYMILTELSKNVDGYRLSCFLNKENAMKGGKINAGPPWDYDLAWHNCNYGNTMDEKFWQLEQPNDQEPMPVWWQKLFMDPYFRDRLWCRFKTFRAQFLTTEHLHSWIDNTAWYLNEAMSRNFRQFPTMGAYIYPNPQSQAGASYGTEIADLKNWVSKRLAWMDANMPGYCTDVGFPELAANGIQPEVFPNPFAGELMVNLNGSNLPDEVHYQIFDIAGQSILKGRSAADTERSFSIASGALSPGAYILQLQGANKTYFKKIIKTGN